jgi:hypothetical protein
MSFAKAGVGEWLEAGLSDEPWLFGTVPKGFEAYARIFHPAYRAVEDGEPSSFFAPMLRKAGGPASEAKVVYSHEVRWSEVAAANGRVAHAAMHWETITGHDAYRLNGDQPGIWDQGPEHGALPLGPSIRLCELLAVHTQTAGQCFFGVSEIWGDLPDSFREGAPLVAGSRIVSGPLFALPQTSFGHTRYRGPNLWWPNDHAWCVVSDIDFLETYVGGSGRCIEQLIADPGLEVMQVTPGQSYIDEINPEPGA